MRVVSTTWGRAIGVTSLTSRCMAPSLLTSNRVDGCKRCNALLSLHCEFTPQVRSVSKLANLAGAYTSVRVQVPHLSLHVTRKAGLHSVDQGRLLSSSAAKDKTTPPSNDTSGEFRHIKSPRYRSHHKGESRELYRASPACNRHRTRQ